MPLSLTRVALAACIVSLMTVLPAPAHAVERTPSIRSDSLPGTVVDTVGHPISGARISIAELGRATFASGAGTFVFVDVPQGTYTVIVRADGFLSVIASCVVPQRGACSAVLRRTSLRLEPVTVTATRQAMSTFASALPTDAIQGERLRRDQQLSLAHTLDGVAGVRTLSTGEQVGKPVIRGLTGPRVLVLDNGLRLEDYSWSDEDGPSIDARLFERVEVIRGPASVLYGSDAIGGVINAVPDALPDARGRAGFFHEGAEFYTGSNSREVGGLLRLEGAAGALGWRAVGARRQSGNIHTPIGNTETPTGNLYDTGFDSFNGELAVGLTGTRSSGTLRYERYGGDFGLLDGPPEPADNEQGPRRRLADDRLQFTSNWLVDNLRIETRSQWQRHALREVVGASRAGIAPPIFDLLLNTYTTDVVIHHTPRPWLTGAIGLSGLYQEHETSGQVPLVPRARTAGGALFAFEQATSGAWSLLAGVRGDLRHLNADTNAAIGRGPQSLTTSAVTGTLGVVYRPIVGLAVAANVGRAFRSPTLYELFTNGPRLGEGRIEVGLPDAQPETSVNADLSLRWESGRFHAEIDGYRNQIDHYLYVQNTGTTTPFIDPDKGDTTDLPVYRYLQTARAILTGIDLSSEFEVLPAVTLRAGADLVHGTNVQTHEPLPLMPPLRGNLEAEWHTTGAVDQRAYLMAGVQGVAAQDRLGPFDTPTSAYTLLQLGGGLSHTYVGRRFMLDLRMRNALNTRYEDFLSRYKTFAYGQGRNVVLRLSTGL